MEQIKEATSVKEAAICWVTKQYEKDNYNMVESFKAGANWQKEQDKELTKKFLEKIWLDIKSPSWSFSEWWAEVGEKRFNNFTI
jgi:hypothetical protein